MLTIIAKVLFMSVKWPETIAFKDSHFPQLALMATTSVPHPRTDPGCSANRSESTDLSLILTHTPTHPPALWSQLRDRASRSPHPFTGKAEILATFHNVRKFGWVATCLAQCLNYSRQEIHSNSPCLPGCLYFPLPSHHIVFKFFIFLSMLQ